MNVSIWIYGTGMTTNARQQREAISTDRHDERSTDPTTTITVRSIGLHECSNTPGNNALSATTTTLPTTFTHQHHHQPEHPTRLYPIHETQPP